MLLSLLTMMHEKSWWNVKGLGKLSVKSSKIGVPIQVSDFQFLFFRAWNHCEHLGDLLKKMYATSTIFFTFTLGPLSEKLHF